MQAMSAVDDDATITQLATAWVDVQLVGWQLPAGIPYSAQSSPVLAACSKPAADGSGSWTQPLGCISLCIADLACHTDEACTHISGA